MFLHIGNNNTILEKEIIAILDKKTVDNSEDTKVFIENLIEDGFLLNPNVKDIKTYIVTCTNRFNKENKSYFKKYGLYASNISSTALYKRNK